MFLEIVVPTYNRAHILRSTLTELCAAVSTQSEHLALRVIDNSSTDATPDVVKYFSDRMLLRSDRNASNIGLVRNIARCISTSSAEWVWVFGDDDHVLLHCLPMLLRELKRLPQDVVFARGLAAKVDEKSRLVWVDSQLNANNKQPAIIYNPGLDIVKHGSIHSLAFISQLFIRPAHWDQSYHDSIYKDSDLYTFVLTLLHESLEKSTADLNFHVVAATDRGDRGYYTPNMCVARLTEYLNFEKLVFAAAGPKRARRMLKKGRKHLLRQRIASVFKLIGYRSAYRIDGRDPISFMLSYQSPYCIDQIIVRALALLATIPAIRECFKSIYDNLLEFHQRRT